MRPLGPHLLTARDGSQALCGGPGICPACEYDATLATLRADNKALLEALKRIVSDFECDYVLDGVIVDDPPTLWIAAYKFARAAIAHSERQMNQERKS